jgi:hypothetical protein
MLYDTGLFGQYGVQPNQLFQRPNGRPLGTRDGMGATPPPRQFSNPIFGGLQFSQVAPQVARPRPVRQQAQQPGNTYVNDIMRKYGMMG